MGASLPFLTLPDPLVTGEGALDPLGLAMVGDHLANQILPGLRARMSWPRFLTAIAVSAAVCEGLEERFAADGITPAYLVFEWLVVEAFVREGKPEAALRTPGIQTSSLNGAVAPRLQIGNPVYCLNVEPEEAFSQLLKWYSRV